MSEEIVQQRSEKLGGRGRAANVLYAKHNPLSSEVLVSKRYLSAYGMVQCMHQRSTNVDDPRLRNRSDGIQNLPVFGQIQGNFRIFKWNLHD